MRAGIKLYYLEVCGGEMEIEWTEGEHNKKGSWLNDKKSLKLGRENGERRGTEGKGWSMDV